LSLLPALYTFPLTGHHITFPFGVWPCLCQCHFLLPEHTSSSSTLPLTQPSLSLLKVPFEVLPHASNFLKYPSLVTSELCSFGFPQPPTLLKFCVLPLLATSILPHFPTPSSAFSRPSSLSIPQNLPSRTQHARFSVDIIVPTS